MYKNKRVLVTGGLGFIGSNLAIRLVREGAHVTVLDSAVPGCGANPFNIAPVLGAVRVLESDIGHAAVRPALEGTDIIFNLAGEISHTMSMSDPERDLRINTTSQLRFLLSCREICPNARIVYASTRQVYGKPAYLPVDEQHPVEPIDFNGVHKNATTQYHLLLTRRGELDCVVLRLSNVYGPRMALNLPQQGFLNTFLRRALEGQPIVVYGDGVQLRDPVHVEDTVQALLLAGLAPRLASPIYNIGGPEPLSLMEIGHIVARAAGSSMMLRPFPEELRTIDVGGYASDTRKARRDLGWEPGIRFEAGVESALAYYRANAQYYPFAPSNKTPFASLTAAGGAQAVAPR